MRIITSPLNRTTPLTVALLSLALPSCHAAEKPVKGKAVSNTTAKSSATAKAAPAVSTVLAKAGKAQYPVIIAANASPRVREAVTTLLKYLQQMSGATFTLMPVKTPLDTKGNGLVVGLNSDFTTPFSELNSQDQTASEDYILRSQAKGLLIAGAGENAIEDAVWDLLYRLGYRQFFPGATWEVVPKNETLQIAVNATEHPAYYSRRIWFGYGSLPENKQDYIDWCTRNRAVQGITLTTGHAYGNIIHRNKAAFAAHPEYLALVGGKRVSSGNAKFCISNSGLRQLVVEDALRQIDADPATQMVSVEPSDGGGWCECPECAKMGSVTDRAVTLANDVASAIQKKYPGKFVGMYAYNEHSPPPTIAVQPNVVISIATSFIRGGYTIDQLLEGWHKKAQILGIREYYSVMPWDHDLPGQARGSNLDYLKRTIPHFQDQGARFLSAESSDNWGPNGLGYYIASRILWDTAEANRVDALVEDFLTKAFGPAREPMAEWYRLTDGTNKPLVSADLIGRMYRQIDKALQLTKDPAIRARLYDLALYTRYVELYTALTGASGPARQAAYEAVMRFSYRTRTSQMTHTLGFWRGMPRYYKDLSLPAEVGWGVKEPKNPWKSSAPYSPADIEKFIADGIKNNDLIDFQPVSYSDDLVPASTLKLGSGNGKTGDFDFTRGLNLFYTWVEKTPADIALQVRSGMIYQDRGDTKVTLFPKAETLDQAVDEKGVTPDKAPHDIVLKTTYKGLQRIEVTDGSAATLLSWTAGTPMAIESSLTHPARLFSRWSLYFYVPKGTRTVGGYADGSAKVLDGSGKAVTSIKTNGGYWSVSVPDGQDGKAWKFDNAQGQIMLMTVPPYLAKSPAELMVPAEVAKADGEN